jgi:hypothetical protein
LKEKHNPEEWLTIQLTYAELNRVRHAVNLGILNMNLKSREVHKVIEARDKIKAVLEESKQQN